MSREAVTAFIEAIAKDPSLQQEIAELASRHGYDFTSGELNDSDLAGIAGAVGAFLLGPLVDRHRRRQRRVGAGGDPPRRRRRLHDRHRSRREEEACQEVSGTCLDAVARRRGRHRSSRRRVAGGVRS